MKTHSQDSLFLSGEHPCADPLSAEFRCMFHAVTQMQGNHKFKLKAYLLGTIAHTDKICHDNINQKVDSCSRVSSICAGQDIDIQGLHTSSNNTAASITRSYLCWRSAQVPATGGICAPHVRRGNADENLVLRMVLTQASCDTAMTKFSLLGKGNQSTCTCTIQHAIKQKQTMGSSTVWSLITYEQSTKCEHGRTVADQHFWALGFIFQDVHV